MKTTKLFFLIFLLQIVPLLGEIQSVKIKWNPQYCQYDCRQNLVRRLREVPGVANVEFNAQFGEATLTWKPNFPFAFTPIDTAMRTVGPALHAVNLKVRGTI